MFVTWIDGDERIAPGATLWIALAVRPPRGVRRFETVARLQPMQEGMPFGRTDAPGWARRAFERRGVVRERMFSGVRIEAPALLAGRFRMRDGEARRPSFPSLERTSPETHR